MFNSQCPANEGISVNDAKVYIYTVNNDGSLGELVDNTDLSSGGDFSFVLPEGVYCIMLHSEQYLPILKSNVRVSVGQIENVMISAYKKMKTVKLTLD